VPSMNHLTGGDFALPPAPIEQGVPPLHPDQPCADWMPPYRELRARPAMAEGQEKLI
jgi:hypothetical protein